MSSAVISTTSLVTKRDDIPIESDSESDVAEIDLDVTPAKSVAARHTNCSRGTDELTPKRVGGGGLLHKLTESVKSKSRGKAIHAPRRKERHYAMIEADEERLARALTRDTGVAAGERMHQMAMTQQKRRSASQQPTTKNNNGEGSPDKECTFHPVLSCGTVRLIDDSGAYRPPSERFDAQELRLAKARLIQQHANHRISTAECTF
jgi:hypothetical protein